MGSGTNKDVLQALKLVNTASDDSNTKSRVTGSWF